MSVNEKIRAIREDNDLTQAEVAEKLGITRQQYSLYETGKRPFPIEKLYEFCKAFGISSDYVLELPKGLKWER